MNQGETRSMLRALLERRRAIAKAKGKASAQKRASGESLVDMVQRIDVFATTQGRVVSSYGVRLKAAVKAEQLSSEQQEQAGKLIGLMDQIMAAMNELGSAAKGVKL